MTFLEFIEQPMIRWSHLKGLGNQNNCTKVRDQITKPFEEDAYALWATL